MEELLEGPEVSVFAVCDGVTAIALPVAQDFKRAYDGDAGPNTGGMGSYAPVPGLDAVDVEELVDLTCRPVLAELAARGAPFIGTLFAGLMLTGDGPRVLEYNCRFGDPETQSLLPLVDDDLLVVLAAAAQGDLSGVRLGSAARAAVTVVLAAGDYPAAGDQGSEITGVADAEAAGALVFHAGTALRGGRLVTNGGRVLNVTAVGADLVGRTALCVCSGRQDLVERRAAPRGHRAGGNSRWHAADAAGATSRLGSVISRYSRPAMASIWSDEAKLQRWLDVELAALEGWVRSARFRPRPWQRYAPPRPRPRPSVWRRSNERRTTTSQHSSMPSRKDWAPRGGGSITGSPLPMSSTRRCR